MYVCKIWLINNTDLLALLHEAGENLHCYLPFPSLLPTFMICELRSGSAWSRWTLYFMPPTHLHSYSHDIKFSLTSWGAQCGLCADSGNMRTILTVLWVLAISKICSSSNITDTRAGSKFKWLQSTLYVFQYGMLGVLCELIHNYISQLPQP